MWRVFSLLTNHVRGLALCNSHSGPSQFAAQEAASSQPRRAAQSGASGGCALERAALWCQLRGEDAPSVSSSTYVICQPGCRPSGLAVEPPFPLERLPRHHSGSPWFRGSQSCPWLQGWPVRASQDPGFHCGWLRVGPQFVRTRINPGPYAGPYMGDAPLQVGLVICHLGTCGGQWPPRDEKPAREGSPTEETRSLERPDPATREAILPHPWRLFSYKSQ